MRHCASLARTDAQYSGLSGSPAAIAPINTIALTFMVVYAPEEVLRTNAIGYETYFLTPRVLVQPRGTFAKSSGITSAPLHQPRLPAAAPPAPAIAGARRLASHPSTLKAPAPAAASTRKPPAIVTFFMNKID